MSHKSRTLIIFSISGCFQYIYYYYTCIFSLQNYCILPSNYNEKIDNFLYSTNILLVLKNRRHDHVFVAPVMYFWGLGFDYQLWGRGISSFLSALNTNVELTSSNWTSQSPLHFILYHLPPFPYTSPEVRECRYIN